MVDIVTLIYGALAITAAGLVGYLIKDLPVKAYQAVRKKLMFSVTVYQNDELFDILEDYLCANYNQHYRDVEAAISTNSNPMESNDGRPAKRVLKYKQEESFFTAEVSGKTIFISKSKEKLDKAVSLRDIYYRKYVLRGFRAKEEINQLLSRIVSDYNENLRSGVVRVYSCNAWGDWQLMQDVTVKQFSKVVIEHSTKQFIIDDLQSFGGASEWYLERGIRYKRTYLFSGPPGNGKTTLGMAIADHTQRDIYVLNLNVLESDSHLIRAMSSLGRGSVLLIEDIDSAFNKRDAIDCKLSFSTVINQIDGAISRNGIITVITTNYIDKLDEALLRDGRIDVKLEIGNPTSSLVKEYIEMFYGIKIMRDVDTKGMSMSSVQEFCIKNKDKAFPVVNYFCHSEDKKQEIN